MNNKLTVKNCIMAGEACYRAISSRVLIKVIDEKIDFIHYNPVEAGLVSRVEEYLYRNAVDYSGGKGVLNHVIVVK